MYFDFLKQNARIYPYSAAFYIHRKEVSNVFAKLSESINEQFLKLDYLTFLNLVNGVCLYLKKEILSEKGYVGIATRNNIESIVALYALWGTGRIPVLLNPRSSSQEIERIKEIVGEIKVFNPDEIESIINEVINRRKQRELNVRSSIGAEEISTVIPTSGTSSKVKLVGMSFKSYQESFLNSKSQMNYSVKDIWWLSIPLYHSGGLSILLRGLFSGGSVIIAESKTVLQDPEHVFNKVSPSKLSLVQTQIKRLKEIGFNGIKRGTIILAGGGPIDSTLMKAAIDKGIEIIKVYGATETASFVTGLVPNDFYGHEESAGKVMENVIIHILDEKREVLPSGKTGEVAIKSKTIFKGYINDRLETERRFWGDYYLTGDIGYLDDKGFLYILGRKDSMIISGGEKISPEEVEKAILLFPGIRECAVFGVKSKEWGEEVRAAYISATELVEDDIKEFLTKSISAYKIPKKFIRVSELPKTSLGKVKRDELVALTHTIN